MARIVESPIRFITHGCEGANEQARRRFEKLTFRGRGAALGEAPGPKLAIFGGFDHKGVSVSMHDMSRLKKPAKRRSARIRGGAQRSKLLKKKPVKKVAAKTPPINLVDPLIQSQLKTYEEAQCEISKRKNLANHKRTFGKSNYRPK